MEQGREPPRDMGKNVPGGGTVGGAREVEMRSERRSGAR